MFDDHICIAICFITESIENKFFWRHKENEINIILAIVTKGLSLFVAFVGMWFLKGNKN
jgi:hypothetical protein